MESMFLLIPLVVVCAIAAVLVFVWAVNHGQYDDLDREAQQVLFDEDNPPAKPMTPPSLRDTSPTAQGRTKQP